MFKSDMVQTEKHSTKILLRRKNPRFSSRTNLIQIRYLPIKGQYGNIKEIFGI